jgi:hypothetical protein
MPHRFRHGHQSRRGLDQSATDSYKHAAQMLNNSMYDLKRAAIINKTAPTLPDITSPLELMIAFGNLLSVRSLAFDDRTAAQDERFAKLLRKWMENPNFSVPTFVLALDSHIKTFCEMFGSSDPGFRLFPLEITGFDVASLITFFPSVQAQAPAPRPVSGPSDDSVAWRTLSASCKDNGLCPGYNLRRGCNDKNCGKRHSCAGCGASDHSFFDCKKPSKMFL